MTVDVDDALIVEMARGVIREVAPQEMPMFRANSAIYLQDPQKALEVRRSGDSLLGFGGGVEITLLTPIAMAVAKQVLTFLIAEIGRSAKREATPIIQEQVKRLMSRFRTGDAGTGEPPPLTRAQLAEVRAIAYQTACRLQLAPEQATLLADSTVGCLAVA